MYSIRTLLIWDVRPLLKYPALVFCYKQNIRLKINLKKKHIYEKKKHIYEINIICFKAIFFIV